MEFLNHSKRLISSSITIGILFIIPTLFDCQNQEITSLNAMVQGSGISEPDLGSGYFICKNRHGSVPGSSYELYFVANRVNDSVSGVWSISRFNEKTSHILTGEQHGFFSGGTIEQNKFKLIGASIVDKICFDPSPITIYITGQCKILSIHSQVIGFRDALREKASFIDMESCILYN